MDPIRKSAFRTIVPQRTPDQKLLEKGGASKFEGVKNQAQEKNPAQSATMPNSVTQVSTEQRRVLEGQLRRKMQRAKTPQEIFRPDMQQSRVQLERMQARVEKMPKSPAAESVKKRLAFIEDKFQASEKVLQGLNKMDSPRELLKLQMEMYMLTQNIEIVSKVVEQTTGGVKQIMQTQV